MTDKLNLATAMNWLHGDLVHALTNGRNLLPHTTEVGDNSELHWIEMLRSFLPKRYSVDKAFVIDVNGSLSEQLDVVIHDRQYSPQIFRNANGTVYVPAESVYAVFDAKQDLDRGTYSETVDKVRSARALERTSAPIPHAGGTFDAKEPPRILGGILTVASGWKPPFGEAFHKAVETWSDDQVRLDIGCAANDGAFQTTLRDGSLATEVWTTSPGTLVWFVTRLLAQLQVMATVPAMDIARWADVALQSGLERRTAELD
jgi:hypothetical protein